MHTTHLLYLFRWIGNSLILALLCTACQPSSLEEFREEGQGLIYSLVTELKPVRTLNQLESKKHALKSLFNALIDVIIAAHEYQLRHPEAKPLPSENELSDCLQEELNRLCCIEGGKILLEKLQEEALNKLDTYLQKAKIR